MLFDFPHVSSMSSDIPSSPVLTLPFVDPFVEGTSDNARSLPPPDALTRRSCQLLDDAFGTESTEPVTAVAHGVVGLQADQTHYSDGFALLLGLPQAVAVALRPSSSDRAVFAPEAAAHDLRAGDAPHEGVSVVRAVLEACYPDGGLDVAVVSTVPSICRDAALSALAVAVARAVAGLDGAQPPCTDDLRTVRDDLLPVLTRRLAEITERPLSIAYPLAAYVAEPRTFVLVDTGTREHLPVETDALSALDWAVLDVGAGPPVVEPAVHRARRREAEAAREQIRASGVADIAAFRDLEHRDLEDATDVLPEHLRPVVRHLVTENRRVQKHVAAMRRGDWQMIGALLLMSHASHRANFGDSTRRIDAVVDDVEDLTFAGGIYGAGLASRDGAVLVTGRPPSFDDGLQSLADAFASRTGQSFRVLRP